MLGEEPGGQESDVSLGDILLTARAVRRQLEEKLLRSWSSLFVALIAGCGTSVAQTASVQPREPLDCSFPGAVVLPQNETFGGGEPPSVLVSDAYEADAGPGLYLTARDAFRVLLNGELVVESKKARETVFVPLTLLPGDNVLSVVVTAAVSYTHLTLPTTERV